MFLILIFNVAFVLPLLAIIAILTVRGVRTPSGMLVAARRWLEQHWPVALAVVGLIAGLFCVFIGITGLDRPAPDRTRARSPARLRGIVARR